MSKESKTQKHRERGRGRRAFWILVAVGLTVTLVAAARGSRRDQREYGHRTGAREELSLERIQELFAEDGRWLDRLGIGEEQRPRIAAVLEGSVPRLQAIAVERDELRQELVRAFAGPTTDVERIEELRWEAAEIVVRALDEGFDVAVELAEVLTPEQRRELIQHWEKR
jgi:Spy/CpxP family protein refolding chaperone